jgi:hypothetical protein
VDGYRQFVQVGAMGAKSNGKDTDISIHIAEFAALRCSSNNGGASPALFHYSVSEVLD